MSDSTLPKFLAYGTNAQRTAFTPTPASLAAPPYQLYFWRETDTGHLFAYDTAWHDLGPAVAIGTNVQAWDADLDALAALSSTGLIARTGAGAVSARTLTAPAAGITVSNGNGVSGNPTLALANDLAALEGLSGTNTMYYRSGADTWSAVTIGAGLSFSGGSLTATGFAGSGAVTGSGLTMSTARLLGRTTASTGAIEEVSVGSSLSFSAGALNFDLTHANTWTGKQTLSGGADVTPESTPSTTAVGYLGAPQNTQNGAYTTVMADAGKHLYHTSATAHTWTIDSNANVAYPIGTVLTFVNENGGGNVTLAITSDTLRWGTSTGSRTLAANGTATALKVASTTWRLTGDGIT